MKNLKLTVLAAFILFISSCQTTPSYREMKSEMENYILPFQPKKDSVLIYIVRPSLLATLIKFNIFLDDKKPSSEIGYTRGGEHINFYTTPGSHTIFSKAENWDQLEISGKGGDVIFIKQNPRFGFLYARNKLEIIDDIEGKYYIENSDSGYVN